MHSAYLVLKLTYLVVLAAFEDLTNLGVAKIAVDLYSCFLLSIGQAAGGSKYQDVVIDCLCVAGLLLSSFRGLLCNDMLATCISQLVQRRCLVGTLVCFKANFDVNIDEINSMLCPLALP